MSKLTPRIDSYGWVKCNDLGASKTWAAVNDGGFWMSSVGSDIGENFYRLSVTDIEPIIKGLTC